MMAELARQDEQVRGVKGVAKAWLRGYGMATASHRGLPDFLIIGAKRAGSTSLWNYVVRHPNVLPMFPARLRIKGTSFFTANFDKGVAWYRSHFATGAYRSLRQRTSGVRPLTGEATPYYLYHPLAPARAATVVPGARLVVILRNPVDRAFSHYRERVRHGVETLSFEDAIVAEDARLAGEEERILEDAGYMSFAHEHLSYVAQGRYAPMLERWLSVFPSEQLLPLLNEEFDRDRDGQLSRLFSFLQLPPWTPPPLRRFNFHEGPPMDAGTRAWLVDQFRDDNRRLEGLLGLDLSVWNS